MRMRPVLCLVALLLVATQLAVLPSAAAEDSGKPLRLIVPGAAGSPPDALARILAEPLASLGRPVVVDNRPGAIGTLAMGALGKAAPDGRTLALMGLPQLVAPGLLREMPYDTLRDLAPVTQLVWTSNVLVVRPDSPWRTLADVVSLGKQRPDALSCATAGTGTPSHLALELLRQRAGVRIVHVPFKGIPAGLTALMGGQVDIAFSGVATALPLVKAGKLRALASAGAQRLPALPDLPTIAEQGLQGYRLNEWYGLAAPSGTPPHVIARLARELARIVAEPDVRARLENLGLYPVDQPGPDAFAATLRVELPRWTQFVRDSGMRVE